MRRFRCVKPILRLSALTRVVAVVGFLLRSLVAEDQRRSEEDGEDKTSVSANEEKSELRRKTTGCVFEAFSCIPCLEHHALIVQMTCCSRVRLPSVYSM